MLLLSVPILFAVGCAAAIVPVAEPETAPSEATQGASRELEGTLTYTRLPETKSVEAYEGIEFRVAGTAVEPSEAVSRDVLMGLDGKSVTVRCTMRTPPPPARHESYPVGMDGRALPRPDRCTVSSIINP